jgi:hypothetical protein
LLIIERERVEAGEEWNHTFRRREKEERRQGELCSRSLLPL